MNHLLVLGWHSTEPTPAFPGRRDEHVRGFARQLRMLARHATVISLRDACELMHSGRPLPPRAVALTFDDGYRDHVDLVIPALAREGLTATFFLVPGFLAGEHRAWWEALAAAFRDATAEALDWQGQTFDLRSGAVREQAHEATLATLKTLDHDARQEEVDRLRQALGSVGTSADHLFMDWEGARALRDAGHEIGSHTVRHPILSRETVDVQRWEIETSRRELQDELGIAVTSLAYPNGLLDDYGPESVDLVAGAGYRCAVTTRVGLAAPHHSRYEIRRILVGPTTKVPGHAWWVTKEYVRAQIRGRADHRAGALE